MTCCECGKQWTVVAVADGTTICYECLPMYKREWWRAMMQKPHDGGKVPIVYPFCYVQREVWDDGTGNCTMFQKETRLLKRLRRL